MTFNMHEQMQDVASMIRIFNDAFNPCKSCVHFTSSRTLDGICNFLMVQLICVGLLVQTCGKAISAVALRSVKQAITR